MELTQHARKRIQGRTSMLAEDVLYIISKNAAILLGQANGYEYLLFYSAFDRVSKIAVVSQSRSHLISVWNQRYFLPKGVGKPTKARKKAAYVAYRQIMFDAFLDTATLSKEDSNSATLLHTEIEISVDKKVIHSRKGPDLLMNGNETALGTVVKALSEYLIPIIELAEEMKAKANGKIHYDLYVQFPKVTRSLLHYSLSHRQLKRLLRKSKA